MAMKGVIHLGFLLVLSIFYLSGVSVAQNSEGPFTSQSISSLFSGYITTNGSLSRAQASADATDTCNDAVAEDLIKVMRDLMLSAALCESYPGCRATISGPQVTGNCGEPDCSKAPHNSGWVCDFEPKPEVWGVVFCDCQSFDRLPSQSMEHLARDTTTSEYIVDGESHTVTHTTEETLGSLGESPDGTER